MKTSFSPRIDDGFWRSQNPAFSSVEGRFQGFGFPTLPPQNLRVSAPKVSRAFLRGIGFWLGLLRIGRFQGFKPWGGRRQRGAQNHPQARAKTTGAVVHPVAVFD
jgi:hypothetical protein